MTKIHRYLRIATVTLAMGAVLGAGCFLRRDSLDTAMYRQEVRKHPEQLNPRLNLARQLEYEGRISDSEAEYKAILATRPDTLSAIAHLARIEQDRNQTARAREYWQQIVDKTGDKQDKYNAGWRKQALDGLRETGIATASNRPGSSAPVKP